MRKLFAMFLVFLPLVYLTAAVRRPVFENFMNHTCGFCVQYEPNITQFINNHTDSLTVVRYHVNWPSSIDPFYLDNPTDNNGRKDYYGVGGVPDNYMDGQINVSYPPTPQALENAYIGAMSEPSYVEIILGGTIDLSTKEGTLNAQIIAEEEPGPGQYYLHIAAVSKNVPYSSGNFSSFSYPMRQMYPYYGGTAVDFSGVFPDTLEKNVNFQLDTTWWHYDENEIFFAVWLQSGVLPYRHIYQSSVIDISELEPVGVEENPNVVAGQTGFLNVYPNPAVNSARIVFSVPFSQETRIDIIDLSGRIVKNFTLNPSDEKEVDFVADLSDLSAGAYIVNIVSGEKVISGSLKITR
ncbi:T9SS type A sorting domain-containing protein [candidate division WOR-3 bacterium]|nr:T9SS type A sorting domain-containing protein [candidate division WOR-3 bacterium]